jgi:hypothetical protein
VWWKNDAFCLSDGRDRGRVSVLERGEFSEEERGWVVHVGVWLKVAFLSLCDLCVCDLCVCDRDEKDVCGACVHVRGIFSNRTF